MCKKFLSLFLAFALLIGQTPAVFAANDEVLDDPTVIVQEVTEDTAVIEQEDSEETSDIQQETSEEPSDVQQETSDETSDVTGEETSETEADVSDEGADEPTLTKTSYTVAPDPGLPGNDELFAAYAESVLYGNSVATFGTAARAELIGDEVVLYDALVPFIKDIAAGNRASAVIVVGQEVSDGETIYPVDAEATFESAEFAYESSSRVLNALLADYPYEMYWYDKTSGCEMWTIGTEDKVLQINVCFMVAQNYCGETMTSVDTAKTGVASKAAAVAQEIVAKYANSADLDKLYCYKQEICNLVTYNDEAAESGDFSVNNDPWQLIYVFDGDATTNVVCEGYSKAFMYLCDLSDFTGDVACYTVSGNMSDGTKTEAHMWNIVTMDGCNYLADVTNSDSGTIGQDGSLFLVIGEGSAADGYDVNGTSYVYDAETIDMWGLNPESILNLGANSGNDDGGEEGIIPSGTTLAYSDVNYDDEVGGYVADSELYTTYSFNYPHYTAVQFFRVSSDGTKTPVAWESLVSGNTDIFTIEGVSNPEDPYVCYIVPTGVGNTSLRCDDCSMEVNIRLPNPAYYTQPTADLAYFIDMDSSAFEVTESNRTVYLVLDGQRTFTNVELRGDLANYATCEILPAGNAAAITFNNDLPVTDQWGARYQVYQQYDSTEPDESGGGGTETLRVINNSVSRLYLNWAQWRDDGYVDEGVGGESELSITPGSAWELYIHFTDGETDLTVPASQLTVGDEGIVSVTYHEEYPNVAVVEAHGLGETYIAYSSDGTEYQLPVVCELPTYGFYSQPEATEANYLQEFVLSESFNTLYYIARDGYTIKDIVLENGGEESSVVLSDDGTIATITLGSEFYETYFVKVTYTEVSPNGYEMTNASDYAYFDVETSEPTATPMLYFTWGQWDGDKPVDEGAGNDSSLFTEPGVSHDLFFHFTDGETVIPVTADQLTVSNEEVVRLEAYDSEPNATCMEILAFGDTFITYTHTDGVEYSVLLHSQLPAFGFYSQPELKEDYFLSKLTLSEDSNTFYFIANNGWTMKDFQFSDEYCTANIDVSLSDDGEIATFTFPTDGFNQESVEFSYIRVDWEGNEMGRNGRGVQIINNLPHLVFYHAWFENGNELTIDSENPLTRWDCTPHTSYAKAFLSVDGEEIAIDPTQLKSENENIVTIEVHEDQPDFAYFDFCGFGDTYITYTENGKTYSLPVYVGLPAFGFYSQPVWEEQYYLREFNATEDNDTIYLVAQDGWSFSDLRLENGPAGTTFTVNDEGTVATFKLPHVTMSNTELWVQFTENTPWGDSRNGGASVMLSSSFPGLYYREPYWDENDNPYEDLSQPARTSFDSFPKKGTFAIPYFFDGTTEHKLSGDQLYSDNPEVVDINLHNDFPVFEPVGYGNANICYDHTDGKTYSIPVSVELFYADFYSTSEPSEETFIRDFIVTDTNRTFYLAALDGFTISNVQPGNNWPASDIVVADDGSYATITIREGAEWNENWGGSELNFSLVGENGISWDNHMEWIKLINGGDKMVFRYAMYNQDGTAVPDYSYVDSQYYTGPFESNIFLFMSIEGEEIAIDPTVVSCPNPEILEITPDSETNTLRMNPVGFGETYLSYTHDSKEYKLPVHVMLPDVAFYTKPTASEEYYIRDFVLSDDNDTVYLVARNDCTFTDLEVFGLSDDPEVTVSEDNTVATIKLAHVPTYGEVYANFVMYNPDGQSWNNGMSFRITSVYPTFGIYYANYEDGVPSPNTEWFYTEVWTLPMVEDVFPMMMINGETVSVDPAQVTSADETIIKVTPNPDVPTALQLDSLKIGQTELLYKHEGVQYSILVTVDRPGMGFYTSADGKDEEYIREFELTEDNNVIYLVADDRQINADLMLPVVITDHENFPEGTTFEATDKANVIKITIPTEGYTGDSFFGLTYRGYVEYPDGRVYNMAAECGMTVKGESEPEVISGTCGENLTWVFDEESGTLTINGTGAMYDYAPLGENSENESPFSGADVITSVIVNEGVTYIGSNAFEGCSMTLVQLPTTLEAVGENAFKDWNGEFLCIMYPEGSVVDWLNVSLSEGNHVLFTSEMMLMDGGKIGEELYWQIIDGTLTFLARGTGSGMYESENGEPYEMPWAEFADEITKIDMQKGITINDGAFAGLTNVTELTLPAYLLYFQDAIGDLTALEKIEIPAENDGGYEVIADGKAILRSNTETEGTYTLYAVAPTVGEEFTVPAGVTCIHFNAFKNCANIKTLNIPASTTLVLPNAFSGCSGLTTVNYGGTEAEWGAVEILDGNEALTDAKINTKHVHTEVIDEAIAVTCTTAGLTEGSHCDVCGEVIVAQKPIPATGHYYDAGTVLAEPTCTTDGQAVSKCTVCGDTITARNLDEILVERLTSTANLLASISYYSYGPEYILSRMTWKYDVDYTYRVFTVSAEEFEAEVGKYFKMDTMMIQMLREYAASLNPEYASVYYDAEANAYVIRIGGGMGGWNDERQYVGYVKNGSEYTVYYRTINYIYLQNILPEGVSEADFADQPGYPFTIEYNGNTFQNTIDGYVCIESLEETGRAVTMEFNDNVVRIVNVWDFTAAELPAEFDDVDGGKTGHKDDNNDYHCDVCGENVCASHVPVAIPAVDATCTETGLTEGSKCEKCGKVLEQQEVVPALGHTEGDVMIENEIAATCTTAGSADYVVYCAECGEELNRETIEVPMTAHDVSKVEAKEATFTAAGCNEHYKCNDCGALFLTEQDAADNKPCAKDKVILPQNVDVSAGKAEVKEEVMEEAISNSTETTVTLPLTEAAEETKAAQLPVASLDKVAEAEKELTVETNYAVVTMDTKALETIVSEAGTTESIELVVEEIASEKLTEKQQETVSKKKVEAVISAEIICGDENISDFQGGTITVRIPFIPAAGCKISNYIIIYIDENGNVTNVTTEHGDGYLEAELPHFSEYAIEDIHEHKAGEAVKENIVEASCTAAGSYDNVVYCTECPTELNRETIPVPVIDHVDNDDNGKCDVCGGDMGLLGDANGDGAVDQSDVTLIFAYVLGQATLTEQQLLNADVNNDNGVDQSDVTKLFAYILGQITTL